jgi:NAD(P)-dependent dehydrogenase (short-subunit alcohol dehydrogenase family)
MADRSGWERKPAFELEGRRVLVIGAETPAGTAAVTALAEAGGSVAAVSASGAGSRTIAGAAQSRAWDVGDPRAMANGIGELARTFGPAEILVTATDAFQAAPITATSDDDYLRVMAVNAGAVFFAAREFLRQFPAGASDGRIICITSVFGQRGIDDLAAYGAAHGAVHNLVRMLAQETGARDGMTVNAIATGWLTTTPGRGPDALNENRLMRFVPMRRFGEPDEVGPLALLLAGRGSGYISGQILHIDGGLTTHL